MIASETRADQVMVALPIEQLGIVPDLMSAMSLLNHRCPFIPDIYQHATLCGSIEDFGGMPIINLQGSPQEGWNRVMKRLFDFSLTLMGLLVAIPVVGLIAAW